MASGEPFNAGNAVENANVEAEVLCFYIDHADDPSQLRQAYGDNVFGKDLSLADHKLMLKVAGAVTRQFTFMGLARHNDPRDDRFVGFVTALDALQAAQADEFSKQRLQIPFLDSLGRILSGMDMTLPKDIKLLPQVPVMERTLIHQLPSSALAFTRSEAYTVENPTQRHARRWITDPSSRFWGMVISTNDHYGVEYENREGNGPSVVIAAPTGTMSDRSLLALKQVQRRRSVAATKGVCFESYVPAMLTMQAVERGNLVPEQPQLDTQTGLVAGFLEYARTADAA